MEVNRESGALKNSVSTGYVDNQFVMNCYTLCIGTSINGGDERRSLWEVNRSTGVMRHMGYHWSSQVVEYLRSSLKNIAERIGV